MLFRSHQDVVVDTEGNSVTLSGVSSWHEGLKGKVEFQGKLTVKAVNGKVQYKDGTVTVEGADEATLYVSIGTNFINYKDISGNSAERAKSFLEKALNRDYATSFKEHVSIFKKYMDRVSLYLGDNKQDGITTDKRIENFAQTNDAHLVATYFQFGRYLLISSSQPGGQPANLQGIWNDKLLPSWDSKYTCNINEIGRAHV